MVQILAGLYWSTYLTYFRVMDQSVNRIVNLLDLSALDEALALLHFGFRAVVAEPDRILARRGLSRLHHRILFFVARKPDCSISDLLAILGITKQALHGPMRQLVERGLLRSEVDPQNRRSRCLSLSRSGAALEAKLSGIQRDLFAAAFATAGPAAERGFRAVFAAIIGPSDSPPPSLDRRSHPTARGRRRRPLEG
jgi:DNA-binding MarR family transcriptional regulator